MITQKYCIQVTQKWDKNTNIDPKVDLQIFLICKLDVQKYFRVRYVCFGIKITSVWNWVKWGKIKTWPYIFFSKFRSFSFFYMKMQDHEHYQVIHVWFVWKFLSSSIKIIVFSNCAKEAKWAKTWDLFWKAAH